MTIKLKPVKKRKHMFGFWPTNAELRRELESKLPVNNEEEDKAISASLPFPNIIRKA